MQIIRKIDVRVFGKTVPCIAPGGAELIRELLWQKAFVTVR